MVDIKKLIFRTNWGYCPYPKEGDILSERLFMILSVLGWIRFPFFFAWILASIKYYKTFINPIAYAFLLCILSGIVVGLVYGIRMKDWKRVLWTIIVLPFAVYVSFLMLPHLHEL